MLLLLAATIMQSGGDMRPVHNSVDTVNAAAAAIVTAESRAEPPAEPVCASTPYCMIFFSFSFLYQRYYGVLHGFLLDNICSCYSLVGVLYFKTSVTACLCGFVSALALQENCVLCNTCHGAFLACICCRLLIVLLLQLIMEECSYAIRLYKNDHQ